MRRIGLKLVERRRGGSDDWVQRHHGRLKTTEWKNGHHPPVFHTIQTKNNSMNGINKQVIISCVSMQTKMCFEVSMTISLVEVKEAAPQDGCPVAREGVHGRRGVVQQTANCVDHQTRILMQQQ